MSGGVDSSVAAALAVQSGHDVVGVTMKLWGGPSDTGCCSVSDVDDARRVAQQLGVVHHVFNFSEEFGHHVVERYVSDHAAGLTPNPCVECNRHLKFERLLDRATQLGFDSIATGHHARVEQDRCGVWKLRRGADPAKDQSYVLHMLGQAQLSRVLFPVGCMSKDKVRRLASNLGLRTAAKADSQDVCFISRREGREAFLGSRIPLRPARVLSEDGAHLGELPAVELVTVGQRRGLGALRGLEGRVSPSGTEADRRRYVVDVNSEDATVTVGSLQSLLISEIRVRNHTWVAGLPEEGEALEVQMSAHGEAVPAWWSKDGTVTTAVPVRKVAPGQSVVLYRGDAVVGGAIAV
jgi:tRNA-specific 2-thiouridylase